MSVRSIVAVVLLWLATPAFGQAITGRVVDSDRRPLENSYLELCRRDGGATLSLARTISAADGSFLLTPEALPGRPLDGFLRTSREGFADTWLEHIPLQAQPFDLGAVVLHAPVEVVGFVRTADGLPIAGAEILAVLGPEPRPSEELQRLAPVARTDVEGRFRCRTLPPGRVTFGIRAEGFADEVAAARLLAAGTENEFEFTLEPERLARVEVRGPEGLPISGATVDSLADEEAGFSLSRFHSLAAFWRSPLAMDENGLAVLRGLRSTNGQVLVTAPGFEPRRIEIGEAQVVVLEREIELVVESEEADGGPGPALEFVAVKDPTRSDSFCGNCNVTRWARFERDSPAVTVLDDTRWRIAWNSAHAYVDGGEPAQIAALTRDERFQYDVPRREGERFVSTLHFGPTHALTGRIVDPGGEPVSTAVTLHCRELLVPMGTKGLATMADASGNFRFERLGPGDYWLGVEGSKLRVPPLRSFFEMPPRDEVMGSIGLEVNESRRSVVPGLLRGRLTSLGRPVARLLGLLPARSSESAEVRPEFLLSSGEDGNFAIELPPGRYRLVPALPSAREPGGYQDLRHAFLTIEGWQVDVSPSGTVELELELGR